MIAILLILAGQKTTTAPAVTPTSTAAAGALPVVIPKGTQIQLAIAHALSSQTNKVGDTVEFLVAEDVKDSAGHVLIPKQTPVDGTVTAVEGKPAIDHLQGLLGLQATAIHLPSGQTVSVNIQITDHDHGDFRTRGAVKPPRAAGAAAAKYYASGQPQAAANLVSTVAQNSGAQDAMVARGATTGSGKTGGPGAGKGTGSGGGAATPAAAAATISQDPLEEDSAVLLSQIVDFKQSQGLVQGLAGTNLAMMIKTLSSHQQFAQFTRNFSLSGAVSVVGAGVGLYKLACVGSTAFYKHCSIAPGALFSASTVADQTVSVNLPMVARDKWNKHVKIVAPHRFAHMANQVFLPDGKRHKMTASKAK